MSKTRKLKIVLVGSSHASAMKFAWDELGPGFPDIEVNYLAGRQEKLNRIKIGDHMAWYAPDGEQLEEAEITDQYVQDYRAVLLSDADVVLHVGWSNDPAFLRDLMRRVNIDGMPHHGAKTLMSRPAFDAILQDYCQRSMLPDTWHGWTSKHVICVETPRRSEAILDSQNAPKRPDEPTAGYREVFDLACDRLENAMAQHAITFLRQPAHTLAQSGLTRRQYGIGSLRLRNGKHHPSQDLAHMNPDYGKQVWAAVLDKIQQCPTLHQH
ncbi:hypothetical protein [Pseudosulfitobacter sp. SM2401]|uniref:hypothetical protein n=1 Tax=Pseudosulfitobacter sp. SM2401 TaxID=3350098 RepID=UPI0036F44AA6